MRYEGYDIKSDPYTAAQGPEALRAFKAAGGKFNNKPLDQRGTTAAMLVLWSTDVQEMTKLFIDCGGRFSRRRDIDKKSEGIYAVQHGRDAILSFHAAGGIFDNRRDIHGLTAADYAERKSDDVLGTLLVCMRRQQSCFNQLLTVASTRIFGSPR